MAKCGHSIAGGTTNVSSATVAAGILRTEITSRDLTTRLIARRKSIHRIVSLISNLFVGVFSWVVSRGATR